MSQLTRRSLLAAGLTAGAVMATPSFAAAGSLSDERRLSHRIGRLERRFDARVGVAWIDPTDGTGFTHRGDERWAFCSTFKVYAAAAILTGARAGVHDLGAAERINPDAVVVNSPESSDFAGYEMPLRWSMKASLVWSDNTAGNRMIDVLGGTESVTEYARSTGDSAFRLDRREPDLNSAEPGDERDTTTPSSMAAAYLSLLLGDALHPDDRVVLDRWMTSNVTSTARIRAGLPAGWTSADKTGAGSYGTVNDVGIVRAPDGRSFVLALLTDRPSLGRDARGDNALLAELTAEVIEALAHP